MVSELPAWGIRVFAFAFGATWGSFFNVAIYRWPRELSVVSPPSHCPVCKTPIPAYRNVPIFGYLLLRGRAACCGAKLSPRYPLVELLSAVLCLAIAERTLVAVPMTTPAGPAALDSLLFFAFTGGLIVATFVDLEWMEIPDEVTLPATALGLITAGIRTFPGATSSAIGAGLGFLVVQVLFVWAYERLAGRRGMGEGDAKLLMMIGAFLGWPAVPFALVAGSFQGVAAVAVLRLIGRHPTPIRPDAADYGNSASNGEADRGQEIDGTTAGDRGADAEGADEGEAPDMGEDVDRGEDDAAGEEAPYWGHLKLPFGAFLALGAIEYYFFGDGLISAYVTTLR